MRPNRHRLLEREDELQAILAALDSARAGSGRSLVVEGPAGIGKTTLLAAARARADEWGMRVLVARGGELEREFAYGVVRQLFEPVLAASAEGERTRLLDGAAANAASALALAPAPAESGFSDPAAATLHGLYWLVVNLAGSAPLALLVDDVHWADAASARFLVYLSHRLDELPILFVAASRPAECEQTADLLGAIKREPATELLEPAPLSGGAAAELVRESLGTEAGEALCQASYEVAGGNPFLLRELLDAIRRGELAPDADALRIAARDMPRSLSRTIGLRLGSLSPEARALASGVALAGTDAELRHAGPLCGLEPDAAARAADTLIAAGVLASARPLEFVHPLVRAAVHAEIPPAQRALGHLRAAQLLDADGARPEQIASHLLQSEALGDPWVVDRLRRAASSSIERGAPEAATAYLRRALDEPPPAELRPVVLGELGRAEVRAAQPDAAVEHLRAALPAIGDARLRARLAHDLALGLIAPGRYVEAVRMLERAVDDARAVDPELALGLHAELVTSSRLDPATLATAREWAARAPRALAGDTPGERSMLASLALDRAFWGGTAVEAAGLAQRGFADGALIAERTADSGLVFDSLVALIWADQTELAERALALALADVRARGSAIGFARVSCLHAWLQFRRGRVPESESHARSAIAAAAEPGYRVAKMAVAPLVDALIERAELDAADRALSEAGLDEHIPDTLMMSFVLHSRGRLRLAQGRLEEATTDLEELAVRASKWCADNPAVIPYRSGLAVALGRGGRALDLAREELDVARTWGAPSSVGASLRALGQLLTAPGAATGEGEEGLRVLAESVSTLDGSDARLELARSLVELGAAMRRAGRRRDARAPLRRGMELAHECGASALTERARVELVASGARPRSVVRTGVDALTPSELRVARMASDGMTNREIAQSLFVTLRTVEVHLTHAYQKLSIESREELAGALFEGVERG